MGYIAFRLVPCSSLVRGGVGSERQLSVPEVARVDPRAPLLDDAQPLDEGLSRALAKELRHRAQQLGMQVRAEGFVPLQEVLDHLRVQVGDGERSLSES